MAEIEAAPEFFAQPPVIIMAHQVLCPPDWSWDSRKNGWNGFHLWFVAQGRGTARLNGTSLALRQGSCFLLRMWETFVANHDPADPLLIFGIYINFFDAAGDSLAARMSGVPKRHREVPEPDFFRGLLRRCVEYANAGRQAEAGYWLRSMLDELRRLDGLPPAGGRGASGHTLVSGLCDRINAEPQARYRVADLAAQAGCTADHFIRRFQSVMGLTPMRYIIKARIEAAKRLLAYSGYSVKQVADALGYPDAYTFSRQFKTHTGRSPKKYNPSVDTGKGRGGAAGGGRRTNGADGGRGGR